MNWDQCRRALEEKGYQVTFFPSASAAAEYLERSITGHTVGFGDSLTLSQLALKQRLNRHNTVYDPQTAEDFQAEARRSLDTEIYLTSVNALAATGELVNLDGSGNRVAGSLFGHEKVYFVVGRNKLCPDLPSAVTRVRQVAAPKNAMRLGKHTPCAVSGDRCYDCHSPDRICNGLMIHLHKMSRMEMEVVLIDEDLGL